MRRLFPVTIPSKEAWLARIFRHQPPWIVPHKPNVILTGMRVATHHRINNHPESVLVSRAWFRSSPHLQKRKSSSGECSEPSDSVITTTTTTTLESQWITMTEGILNLPVGSFNQGRWNEAVAVLTHWFGNRHDGYKNATAGNRRPRDENYVAIEYCWKILERLCEESIFEETKQQKRARKNGRHGTRAPVLSAIAVLNPILVLWRDDFLEYHRSCSIQKTHAKQRASPPHLPSRVAQQLRRFQSHNLVAMDTATHAILLDTAGKYSSILARGISEGGERIHEDHRNLHRQPGKDSHNQHKQGVLFAHRYLTEWIEEYRRLHKYNSSMKKKSLPKMFPEGNEWARLRPDVVAFGTLVHAWVESRLPGAPQKAEEWVKTWDDLTLEHQSRHQSTIDPLPSTATPNTIECKRKLYTSVLLAWARVGNPAKVQEWIDRMVREKEYPDVQAFNCLLMAYQSASSRARDDPAASFDSAKRAEEVLRHMQNLYHDPNGFLSDPPNVVSYNIVIDAWTKVAGHESKTSSSRFHKRRGSALDAAKRAHGWFEQMKNSGIPANTISYNTVITAYSRAGFPQESEKVLQEMISVHQMPPDSSLAATLASHTHREIFDEGFLEDQCIANATTKPDVQSFSSVLAGWARVGTPEAAERAEELLRSMQRPEVDIEPNVETYGSCIHCWAKVAGGSHSRTKRNNHNALRRRNNTVELQERAVQRAEALFREMREERNISPDVYAYTGLLNVYGRSGRVHKAERFLEACLHEYNTTRDLRMKPTVVTFTAVLNAWSKASNRIPEAPERAHELLQIMKEEYGIQPNVFSYSTVLDAYSRSNHPDAATRALDLFRNMREVEGLEPNAYTCSNVLKAMARGGKVEEAENLLLGLVHDVSVKAKLGPHAFSSVLYGWSKSKSKEAPKRAEALLIEMQELYKKRLIDGPPNAVCWNNVLACWAHSNLPGAAQHAQELLKEIQQQQRFEENESLSLEARGTRRAKDHSGIRCNRIMYNTVMNAWANDGNFEKANDLFQELVENHRLNANFSPPDEWTYRALWKAIIKSNQMGVQEKSHRLQNLLQSMAENGIRLNKNMEEDLKRIRRQQNSGVPFESEA